MFVSGDYFCFVVVLCFGGVLGELSGFVLVFHLLFKIFLALWHYKVSGFVSHFSLLKYKNLSFLQRFLFHFIEEYSIFRSHYLSAGSLLVATGESTPTFIFSFDYLFN